MILRKEYADVAEHVGKQMNEGFYGDLSRSTYILRDLAIKCQSIADEEIGKIKAEHLKLIQDNPYLRDLVAKRQAEKADQSKLIQNTPYCYDPIFGSTWKMGFEAGQKALLTPAPLSITGRWWLSGDKIARFAHVEEYKPIYLAIYNNPKTCRWLTEETTIEFE